MMTQAKKFSYGALPPPGMEWQYGRALSEIDAINKEAQATGRSASEVAQLRDAAALPIESPWVTICKMLCLQ